MRCPKCKGSVPDRITVITCPACGAPVRRIPLTTDFRFAFTVMAERNGWLFWSIMALPFWIAFAMFEMLLGKGEMARLFDDHLFVFLVHCFFTGFITDIMMKVNAMIMQIGEKETLKRAPLALRRFRLGTNVAVLVSVLFSLWYVGFQHWASSMYVISLSSVLLVGIWWAWFPFIISLDEFADRRIENFFLDFGMEDAGRWRRMSLWVMGVYIFGTMISAYMIAVPGAYHWLKESEFIQFLTSRLKTMFYFVPDFFK